MMAKLQQGKLFVVKEERTAVYKLIKGLVKDWNWAQFMDNYEKSGFAEINPISIEGVKFSLIIDWEEAVIMHHHSKGARSLKVYSFKESDVFNSKLKNNIKINIRKVLFDNKYQIEELIKKCK